MRMLIVKERTLLPKTGTVNRAIALSAGIAMLASCALLPGAPKPPGIGSQGAADSASHQKRINEPLRIKYTSGVSKFNLQQVNVPEENYIEAQEVAYWPDGRVKTYRIKGWLNLGGERVWESNIGLWFWDTTVQDEGCKVDWCGDASFFANLNLPENVVSPRGTVRWGGCEIKDVRANINGVSKSYVASTFSVWNNVYQGVKKWLVFSTVDDGAQLLKSGVNTMNGWASTHCNSSYDVRWKCSYPGQPGQGCEVDVSWDTPAEAPPTTEPGGGGSPSPGASPSDGSGAGGDPNGSPSPGSSGDPNGTPGPGGSGDPNGTPAPGGSDAPNGSPSPGSGSPSPSPSGSGSPGSGGSGGDGSGGSGGGDGSGGTGGSGGNSSPSPTAAPSTAPTPQPTSTPTPIPNPTPSPSKTPLGFDASAAFPPLTNRNTINVFASGSWTLSVDYWGVIAKGDGNEIIEWDGIVNRGSINEFPLVDDKYALRLTNTSGLEGVQAEVHIFGTTTFEGGGGYIGAARLAYQLFIKGVRVVAAKPGNEKAVMAGAVAAKLALATKSLVSGLPIQQEKLSIIFIKSGGFAQARADAVAFINRVGVGTLTPVHSPKGQLEVATFLDGTKVIIRSFSSPPNNFPTLELQASKVLKPLINSITKTDTVKIRY